MGLTEVEKWKRMMMLVPRYVYILREEGDAGAIKIGSSNWPDRRLVHIQSGNPREVRMLCAWEPTDVPHAGKTERALHLRFAKHRIRGEWFRPDPEILEFVDSVLAAEPAYKVA